MLDLPRIEALIDIIDIGLGGGGYDLEPPSIHQASEARGAVDELIAEIARLTAELAAAQAELTAARRGPVVEWALIDNPDCSCWRAAKGQFELLAVEEFRPSYAGSRQVGWWITVNGITCPEDAADGLGGPETGPEGKAACFAAYLRAAGLA